MRPRKSKRREGREEKKECVCECDVKENQCDEKEGRGVSIWTAEHLRKREREREEMLFLV